MDIDQFIIEIKGHYQFEYKSNYIVCFERIILKCNSFYLRDITNENNHIDNNTNNA